MKFLRRERKPNPENDTNVFELDCPCGVVGEVGVPVSHMDRIFPHDTCGTLLIQKPKQGFFGHPSLEVVCGAAKSKAAKASKI